MHEGLKCKFEVVIGLTPGLPANASALAEQFIQRGLALVGEEMRAAYGDTLEAVSVQLIEVQDA